MGKPGQRCGETGLCGFPGTPLPKRSSFIWVIFLWPAGQAFTPSSLCQDCCVMLVKVYFDTTPDGVTCCTTAELTFQPPWEALAWLTSGLTTESEGLCGSWGDDCSSASTVCWVLDVPTLLYTLILCNPCRETGTGLPCDSESGDTGGVGRLWRADVSVGS